MPDRSSPSHDLIDNTYDAITMMRLASQILSGGDVDDNVAGEISWMLGSCKKRLEPVIEFLEALEAGGANKGRRTLG